MSPWMARPTIGAEFGAALRLRHLEACGVAEQGEGVDGVDRVSAVDVAGRELAGLGGLGGQTKI